MKRTPKPWRYRLDQPAFGRFDVLFGIDFLNDWLRIEDGRLCVNKGYAWDGCSPAWKLPGTPIWLGTPDGPLGHDGRPAAWQASLFHDALCQFRGEILGLSKAATTSVFANTLAADGAPRWMQWLYPAAVHHLGPQNFNSGTGSDAHPQK